MGNTLRLGTRVRLRVGVGRLTGTARGGLRSKVLVEIDCFESLLESSNAFSKLLFVKTPESQKGFYDLYLLSVYILSRPLPTSNMNQGQKCIRNT